LLAIKSNGDFHLSYYYSALSLDKLCIIKSMRGATVADISDTLEMALQKIEKTISLFRNFSPALNLGRDISRKLFQMIPAGSYRCLISPLLRYWARQSKRSTK
jgi:hypothetical protein